MSKSTSAQEIYDEGRIVNGDRPDCYIVNSASGNSYEVEKVTNPMYNYEFYCKCPAWKFDTSRECKHVLAIKLLIKNSGGNSGGTKVNTKTKTVGGKKSTGWFVKKSNCAFGGSSKND